MAEYVDREELIRLLSYEVGFGRRAISWIEKIPIADVEPVTHGMWTPTEYDSFADGNPVWDMFMCSECGYEHWGEEDTLTLYCPDCGAKMDGTGWVEEGDE